MRKPGGCFLFDFLLVLFGPNAVLVFRTFQTPQKKIHMIPS